MSDIIALYHALRANKYTNTVSAKGKRWIDPDQEIQMETVINWKATKNIKNLSNSIQVACFTFGHCSLGVLMSCYCPALAILWNKHKLCPGICGAVCCSTQLQNRKKNKTQKHIFSHSAPWVLSRHADSFGFYLASLWDIHLSLPPPQHKANGIWVAVLACEKKKTRIGAPGSLLSIPVTSTNLFSNKDVSSSDKESLWECFPD